MNAVGVFENALPLLRAALELVYGQDNLLVVAGRVRVTARCEQTPSAQGRYSKPSLLWECLLQKVPLASCAKLNCIDLLNPAQSECSHFLISL